MPGQTSYWTSGTAEGVSASVGTWGHRTPCTWVEAGKAPWSAEAGLSTALVGGSTSGILLSCKRSKSESLELKRTTLEPITQSEGRQKKTSIMY